MTIHVDWLTLLVLAALVGAAIVVWTRRWSSRRHEEPTANTLALDPVVEWGSEDASQEEAVPLIDVTPIEIDGNSPEIHIPDSVRTFLESTIQRSPSLVQSGQNAFDKGLRAVFSKEVTRALQSGDAILVKDAAGRTLAKARDAKSGRWLGSARAVAQGGGAGVVEFGQELFRAKDVDEGEHLVLFFLHGGQREAQNHGKDEAEQGRVEGHAETAGQAVEGGLERLRIGGVAHVEGSDRGGETLHRADEADDPTPATGHIEVRVCR